MTAGRSYTPPLLPLLLLMLRPLRRARSWLLALHTSEEGGGVGRNPRGQALVLLRGLRSSRSPRPSAPAAAVPASSADAAAAAADC